MQVWREIAACVRRPLCSYQKVRTSRLTHGVYSILAVLLGLSQPRLFSAWQDATTGLPPVKVIPAKAMGTDQQKSQAVQDRLGRIFIASRSLLVFDGQAWRSHAKPGEASLTFLAQGPDETLWTGMNDNLGFFREELFGEFKFHSLLDEVPASALPLGLVWGCAPLGAVTYFVCNEKLLRWDGREFQVTPFPTRLRLAPLRIGNEHWLQHLETGLYELTETGPVLRFPADQLPVPLIIGLFRDESGLVTVSNDGLRRPGHEPHSPPELKQYLTQHKVSSFCELPDGNLVIGTLSGGLLLTSRTGDIIRLWADANSGLPGRTIISLMVDPTGAVFGTTPTDFFHFPSTGGSTLFNARNGLRGQAVNAFARWNDTLYVATDDGAYQQVAGGGAQAAFRSLPLLGARYNAMLPDGDSLLLTRFGGVDRFDGRTVHAVYALTANSALHLATSRANPRTFYVTEYRGGVARVTQQPDGTFERELLGVLPGVPTSLHEGPDRRLWLGTIAHGAFILDPASRTLTSLNDPATNLPFTGRVRIVGDDTRVLLFVNGRVWQANPLDQRLHVVPGLPALVPSVVQQLSGGNYLVAHERPAITGPLHGAGLITFAADGTAAWREFDLTHLDAIGSIGAVDFTEEAGRPVLWLGGIEGILRIDYAQIPALATPTPPLIRLQGEAMRPGDASAPPEYPFKESQLQFRIFTGDYLRGKDWLFQTRLGRENGEWSAPVARRSFDYSSLSEGLYEFEVRAINSAGVAGPAATYAFRILPPWYRSGRAYTGYAAILALAVFGYIRFRERRIRIRNQELEGLVEIRTAELVKASAAKDEFLAGVSHEIRNPMNGVIGIAENFRTEGLDPESRRKFSLLRQCASHLSSLLEDILDFSKVQAGAIELDPKPFDLVDLVESVGAITRPDSEKYGIPVELAVSPAVPRELVGDARRIRQILINFVSNALKFSGRGQVSVTVWCKSLGPAQTEVIFAVSDEGPGISAEEQARLFTRFERGAAAQKGRVPGTGLGLALCKGIAEKMGGRIWLESELGHGSCFYFSAPFALAEAPAGPATFPSPGAAAATRTALVVDDQEYNRIVLADLLQAMGFTVHSAQEGTAALNLAAKQAFDVVFLDFNLPGLSGVDVARGIRALPGPTAHALILATTAFTTPEKRAQCLDAGMDAFLGKPVTKERLAKALANLAPAATPAAIESARPPAHRPAPANTGPADRLGNLRLLARKKGVPFADELALYLSELEVEFDQLKAALQQEDAAGAGRYAHMLCGRCSFVYERDLEQTQRRIEAAVGNGQWAEARRLGGEFAAQLADLRVRLASSGPAVPPA
jgi:signal transduction histidine kinase/CheY-like chemotaxis protein/HPt (histidine-containing phosphotransfer) domain-containing protein